MRTLAASAPLAVLATLLALSSVARAQIALPLDQPPPPLPLTMQIPPPPPGSPEAPDPSQVAPAMPPPVYPANLPLTPPAAAPISILSAAPKALSLTVGWSYTPTNTLPVSTQASVVTPQGVNVDLSVMWQVRGFDGLHWPAWVGVMGTFLYYGGQNGVADITGMAYGLYVKHALFTGRRARLFAGYGLGAAQVWILGLDGRGAGSYTRLSIGVDTNIKRWLHATVEFSYRFFNLPTYKLADTDSGGYDMHALSILAGFWLGR